MTAIPTSSQRSRRPRHPFVNWTTMMALSHPQHQHRRRRHNYDRAATRSVTGIRMVAFFLATIMTQNNTVNGFALRTLSPPPPPTAAPSTRRPVSASSSTALSSTSRRDFWEQGGTASMTAAAAVVAVVGPVPPVAAATATTNDHSPQQPERATTPGVLENRLRSPVLEAPPFGMEGTDIFYPAWFNGGWKIRSETTDVQAPCGVGLFGGNRTYTTARDDIGNILSYECRFLPAANSAGGASSVIADREFNVKSIVKVTMGDQSMVDVSLATPNKFSCLLAPAGAPTLLAVDLLVVQRRQEYTPRDTPNRFYCSEVVREIAKPVGGTTTTTTSTPTDKGSSNTATNQAAAAVAAAAQQPPRPTAPAAVVLKEIETISVYNYDPVRDVVHCTQRSAAFLLPSDRNEVAMKMWQFSRGRAIDVRSYDVTYTRG